MRTTLDKLLVVTERINLARSATGLLHNVELIEVLLVLMRWFLGTVTRLGLLMVLGLGRVGDEGALEGKHFAPCDLLCVRVLAKDKLITLPWRSVGKMAVALHVGTSLLIF